MTFPGFFASLDPESSALVERFWTRAAVPGLDLLPANGFWLRVRG